MSFSPTGSPSMAERGPERAMRRPAFFASSRAASHSGRMVVLRRGSSASKRARSASRYSTGEMRRRAMAAEASASVSSCGSPGHQPAAFGAGTT